MKRELIFAIALIFILAFGLGYAQEHVKHADPHYGEQEKLHPFIKANGSCELSWNLCQYET